MITNKLGMYECVCYEGMGGFYIICYMLVESLNTKLEQKSIFLNYMFHVKHTNIFIMSFCAMVPYSL